MAKAKVSIIGGAGRVGSTLALYLAERKLADVVLVDIAEEKAKGVALDILQALPVYGNETKITAGSYEDTKNSDVVVITAGLPRNPGMTREELLEKNSSIMKSVVTEFIKYSPNTILLIVSNPLDAMVYVASEVSKFPKNRIIGMAGILDTSRFKAFIAEELNVAPKEIETVVLGSHGNEMVPLLSHTFVNKKPLKDLLSEEKINAIIERTRNAGAEIVGLQKDTSAYIAPAASIAQMIDSILNDKKMILPCSAYINGEYGAERIFIGVPAVLGKDGVEKIIELKLEKEEKEEFEKSVESIKNLVKNL